LWEAHANRWIPFVCFRNGSATASVSFSSGGVLVLH
jgi:hypothetical protein